MGTLKIRGSIKLNQFWPKGKSDADTSKIVLSVNKNAFEYYSGNSKKPKLTKVFLNAEVIASGNKNKPIKFKTSHPQVTVRFQGIDAPELHYRFYDPKTLGKYKTNKKFKAANIDYRQYFSETATVALANLLKAHSKDGGETVDCTFVSENISNPSDVCDMFGRFVGDILIDKENINLNEWLLRQGYVFPAFYNSMKDTEIKHLTNVYKNADNSQNKTLGNYSKTILPFNKNLKFREKGSKINAKGDKGKMLFPKIYRRQCCYEILKMAGETNGLSLLDYFKSKTKDNALNIADLPGYRKAKNKDNYNKLLHITAFIKNKTFTIDPSKIIFIEGESKLVTEGTKNEILSF